MGLCYDVKDHREDNDDIDYSYDVCFVLEPGVNLILNVNKKFRIGAGVNYRYVNGVDYENLSNSDLSGVTVQIVLKFGDF